MTTATPTYVPPWGVGPGLLPPVRRYAPDVATTTAAPPPAHDPAARRAAVLRRRYLREIAEPTTARPFSADRLTNVRPDRRHAPAFRGTRPAEHPFGPAVALRPAGTLAPLAHDHPDAVLAAQGRTDANGYRYESVTRHHDDGRVSVRYTAPLRIRGAGILRPDGEGIALRAEYRRRDRAAIVARDVLLSARRQAYVAADTLSRIAERVTNGDGPHHFPLVIPGDSPMTAIRVRRSVLKMTSDLIGTMVAADAVIAVARLEARRQHDAARKMVRPILLDRQAERQRRRRAAETPDERAARLARMAERRRERIAAETPDERAARLAKQRDAAKARRARKGG